MSKTFTVAEIRALLNQVSSDKITFSKFVEILNEKAVASKSGPFLHNNLDDELMKKFPDINEQMNTFLNHTRK